MWFYIILLAVIAFFVYANYLGKQEAKVGLSIATFGLNLSVYDLRIGYNKFWIYVDFDNSGNKFQYSGSSIGDIQFNISNFQNSIIILMIIGQNKRGNLLSS